MAPHNVGGLDAELFVREGTNIREGDAVKGIVEEDIKGCIRDAITAGYRHDVLLLKKWDPRGNDEAKREPREGNDG
jgi:hypothetical protein